MLSSVIAKLDAANPKLVVVHSSHTESAGFSGSDGDRRPPLKKTQRELVGRPRIERGTP